MPILRPHAARFHKRCIYSVTFTSAHLRGNVYMRVGVARALTDSFDFGLLGKQSSAKCEIPCRRTAQQIMTPLALSSAEKSVTVQTRTNKQTHKQQPTYPHLAYRHAWITKSPITNWQPVGIWYDASTSSNLK